MTPATNVPVTIQPDAAQHVAELGMQAELERMLEHAQRTIPGLVRIDVWLQPEYDTGGGPCVILDFYRNDPFRLDDPTDDQWLDWRINTFSPDVLGHFSTMTTYETPHAG